jgi:hypothetical protein
MFPPVYQTLRANATVLAMVGDRIGAQGWVPQDTTRPYITWFIVIGQPHDTLSEIPQSDFDSVQIDCWHQTEAGVRQLAMAVRDALDVDETLNRVVVNNRDTETKLYRVGIQADFITQR